jgi:hypothetical protein
MPAPEGKRAARTRALGSVHDRSGISVAPLSQAGLIIPEHLEPGHCDAEETIRKLIAVLDAQELADASERLEVATGCGW